jgi:hypothetical protein
MSGEFAGTLKQRIRIERPVDWRTDSGLQQAGWEQVCDCLAAIVAEGAGRRPRDKRCRRCRDSGRRSAVARGSRRPAGDLGEKGDAGEAADRRSGDAGPHLAQVRGGAMMFERLMARVEDKVRAMAEAARRNLEIAFAAIPDVRLEVEGDALAIEAKAWRGAAKRHADALCFLDEPMSAGSALQAALQGSLAARHGLPEFTTARRHARPSPMR